MENKFTWIPIYKEIAEVLLQFKDDRKPLIEFIYGKLKEVHDASNKPLIEYLKDEKSKEVNDIDPFSVFAIFNRNIKWENRSKFLQLFKEHFELKSSIPTDLNGIPTLDPRRSFFYTWDEKNIYHIENLWNMYEKIFRDESIKEEFDSSMAIDGINNNLTMALFWVAPYKFLALDARNRSYLERYNIIVKDKLDYVSYRQVLDEVNSLMESNEMSDNSYPELSYSAWKAGTNNENRRVWLWNGNTDNTYIEAGKSAKTLKDFFSIEKYRQLVSKYQKAVGNTDVRMPYAYWKMIHEVKPGDIIVSFKANKEGKKYHHDLYGWGVVSQEPYQIIEDENPIKIDVKWNIPFLTEPVRDDSMGNTMFFHQTTQAEADHILELLGIDINTQIEEQNCVEEQMEDTLQKDLINLLKENHNVVLTGAPGTGKTFLAKNIASQMMFGKSYDKLEDTEKKKIGFVQFHPSYDYTDFVEGLRPTAEGSFERKDGVFKTFCKKALVNALNEDKDTLLDLNDDPKVWKVSLSGAGDNPLRTDCMKNNYIRIGWHEYGNVEDFNDITDFPVGGKTILRAFQHEMKIGDVVVSCYGEYMTDAIGIVTGDYEYKADGGDFPRYRSVKWIKKDVRINTKELLNKKMTLSTIYKLNISAQRILELVDTPKNKQNIPHVFIIDEINRGELSKIFGELFYSIDPGYRGTNGLVQTQYQNLVEDDIFTDGFYVPENVYILATMNDIDRSVESMDFALRRRFTWFEIKPEDRIDAMFSNLSDDIKGKAGKAMESINKAIAKEEGLGAAFMIGPAYFLKLAKLNGDMKKLWDYSLEPLLHEYLRGFRNADTILNNFRDAYYSKSSNIESDTEDIVKEE